jgi:hypothetical protein
MGIYFEGAQCPPLGPDSYRDRVASCVSNQSALTFCFFLVKQKESEGLLTAKLFHKNEISCISVQQKCYPLIKSLIATEAVTAPNVAGR